MEELKITETKFEARVNWVLRLGFFLSEDIFISNSVGYDGNFGSVQHISYPPILLRLLFLLFEEI